MTLQILPGPYPIDDADPADHLPGGEVPAAMMADTAPPDDPAWDAAMRQIESVGAVQAAEYATSSAQSQSQSQSQSPTTPLTFRPAAQRRPAAVPVMPSAPPFPVQVLPKALRDLVNEGAAAFDIPADFIAVPLLPLLAAAIGNRVRLRLKDGWTEVPILWAVVVGEPGSGKSGGLSLARRPFDLLQQEARERYEREIDDWTAKGEAGRRPRLQHLYTSDATVEAVTTIHQHTQGLAVIRDEVAGWTASMDAYRKGGDRQTWLTLWSGGAVKVDRKTSDPVLLPDPAVSLCGGVQPDRLGLLLGDHRTRDGFSDRFLFAAPACHLPGWTNDEIAQWTLHDAVTIFRAIHAPGATTVETTLSREAKSAWAAWFRENLAAQEAARQHGAGNPLEQGWLAKGPRHLARLALILHVLAHPGVEETPVTAETLTGAIALHRYFHAHLQAMLPVVDTALSPLEERIAQRLWTIGPEGMTRESIRIVAGSKTPARDIDRALLRLASLGIVERMEAMSTGGRTPQRWRSLG